MRNMKTTYNKAKHCHSLRSFGRGKPRPCSRRYMHKLLSFLFLAIFTNAALADVNWVRRLPCPELSFKVKMEQGFFEVTTITTLREDDPIKGCLSTKDARPSCFYLIPESTDALVLPENFSANSIDIELVNFYGKMCSYNVQGI